MSTHTVYGIGSHERVHAAIHKAMVASAAAFESVARAMRSTAAEVRRLQEHDDWWRRREPPPEVEAPSYAPETPRRALSRGRPQLSGHTPRVDRPQRNVVRPRAHRPQRR